MKTHVKKPECGITLLELLIVLFLIAVIAISFFSLFIFGNTQTVSSERRTQVQNDLSHALEHMSKKITSAVGNEQLYGGDTTISRTPTMVSVYVDGGNPPNGIRDTSSPDYWIAYRRSSSAAIEYCAHCSSQSCGSCTASGGWERLTGTNRVLSSGGFNITKPGGSVLNQNYIDVTLTGRHNSNSAESSTNPQVQIRSRIEMPMVSTH